MNDELYRGIYTLPRIERVVFGEPAADVVAKEATRLGAKRVFVLSAALLAEQTDVPARLAAALGTHHAATWCGISAHTPRDDVIAAVDAARRAGADLLVALGGGSVIDAAKVVATCLANDVRTADQMDALRKAPAQSMTAAGTGVRGPQLPLLAVPTTLAGAEFTAYAGVTHPQTRLKEVFTHPQQVPRVVVLDPAVTLHTPETLWLSTGVRALDHAVEDICSIDAQPYSQGTALQAIRLLTRALPASHRDAANLRARLDAQVAGWLSTVGSQAGVNKGASHGIGHALGGTGGVPHGLTSCILMPHVMRFNEPMVREQHAMISEAMGQPGVPAWQAVAALIDGLGLPRTLREVGLDDDEAIEAVAQAAMLDPWIRTNPRPIEGVETVRMLLEAARG
ncbi:iron-containing alcohol dehydrogenase [uncultured Pseudacidovorax sp.]|uniref:iron-containing alcohol dehydrogenase n=1 Tax=uncultured Pseudacidovorax sp. TaxID=679313 RepID=UPI0025DA606A|nr:iron-containing alcohol dehydrogenase [uncultured Pseudacidovorax sp.]